MLSNYQMTLLVRCQDQISQQDAGRFKQSTFASLVRSGLVEFRRGRWIMTREGRVCLAEFNRADVERKNPSSKLAQYIQWYLAG